MENVIFMRPRIVGFRHIVNPVLEARPVRDASGQMTELQRSKPQLTITVGLVDMSDTVNSTEVYTFTDTAGTFDSVDNIFLAAGVNSAEVWEEAFDKVKEGFSKTKDLKAPSTVGIPLYMRVDVVTANINPYGTEAVGITMTIGCYSDPSFSKVVFLFTLTFADKQTLATRAASLQTLQENKTQLEAMIAGTHVNQTQLSGDELEQSKKRAAVDLQQVSNQLKQQEQISSLVGSVEDVLKQVEVQTALGKVCGAVFRELKSKLPNWKNIVVDDLMQNFPAVIEDLVAR